jgi:hypothetical protein
VHAHNRPGTSTESTTFTGKPFQDGEKIVKECLIAAVQHLAPEKVILFGSIPLSRRTITDRVEEIGADLKDQLAGNCRSFCLGCG